MAAQMVGPYIIGPTLGAGATGKVKLGTHHETKQTVAIKIISKEWLQTKANLARKIEREITLMKLIQHPNIVQLYDVYESMTDLYIIMEHVQGGELFDYLVKRTRLPEAEALVFFQQIISGLDFCHQHLISHRDLKPENLLLDANNNVKIADFGMAAIQQGGMLLETSCGSPHYASPEIIRGEKYNGPPADVWSCGIILYALITGTLPFDDDNIRKLLQKVKSGVYNMPSFVPPGPRDLIHRMLVLDPAKRITIAEIRRHPWFNSNGRVVPIPTVQLPDYTAFPEDVELDENILANIQTLGYENTEEIKKALRAPQPNIEKLFYRLLEKGRDEYFESMDDWDLSPAQSQTDSGILSPRSSGSGGLRLHDGRATLLARKLAPLDLSNGKVVPNYHRASLDIPRGSNSVDTPGRASMSAVTGSNVVPIKARSGSNPSTVGTRRDPASSPPTKVIMPDEGAESESSGSVARTSDSGASRNAIGSPRFHRQRARPQERPSMDVAPTDVVVPKRSWFERVFHFRGQTTTVHSALPMSDTVDALLRTCKALGIKAVMKENSIKCISEVIGKVKFKIEIIPLPTGLVDVMFVQEKGKNETFSSVTYRVVTEGHFTKPLNAEAAV